MLWLANVSTSGIVVIAIIAAVFVFAIGVLLTIFARYKTLSQQVAAYDEKRAVGEFVSRVHDDFVSVYTQNGINTNTPAIIDNACAITLRWEMMGERFLNNAVSIMVTLGLFGTFLGLTQSVSSLSLLVTQSSAGEWENLLDNVGGGLMSALSGMGVAFYTSLVGVACAIIITILRTVFNPQAQREKLVSMTELWLDHNVAVDIEPQVGSDEAQLIKQLRDELSAATESMEKTMQAATAMMQATLNNSAAQIERFAGVVATFNDNVRDFSEFNYNLRHNIEAMDVSFYKLTQSMRDTTKTIELGRGGAPTGGGLRK